MSVEAVGQAGPVGQQPMSSAWGVAPGSLAPSLALPGDVLTLAYLSARSSDQQIKSQGERAARAVERAGLERHERFDELRRQLEKQDDADFWSKFALVAKVVAVVASVAAAAFTGGSTLAVAAAIVSAGFGVASLATDGKLGLDHLGFNKDWIVGINIGISVLLAALTVGASLLSSGASVAAEGANAGATTVAQAGANVTSAAVETTSIAAGSIGTEWLGFSVGAAEWIRGGALGVELVAESGEVGGHLEAGLATADATEHGAASEKADAQAKIAQSERKEAIRMMRNLSEMERRVLAMALEIEESRHKAQMTASRRV